MVERLDDVNNAWQQGTQPAGQMLPAPPGVTANPSMQTPTGQ
jgi:hypothetical protein